MRSYKNEVPRMKETSQLEREMQTVSDNSFDRAEMLKNIMKLVKEDREAMLFEIGTFVLTSECRSYGSQVNYIQGMRDRIKS